MHRIHEEILKAKTVGISGHIKPDGDCLGSCMALYNYIRNRYPEVQVDVYLEAIPPAFTFIKNVDKIVLDCDKDIEHDLFFALDCGSVDRLGKAEKYLNTAKRTICIDHHVSNKGFADINYILPDISSTSEYIYELIDKDYVDIPVAECIYMGIIHDTGVFQYSCTSSRTMAIAGELMDKGIDFPYIVDHSYFMKYIVQNRLMGYCLLNCQLRADDKIIVSILPKAILDEFGGVASDLEGIVAQLRNTKDVEAAIFAYELKEGRYKISMRSCGKVELTSIAEKYSGGGHKFAAGCSTNGDINEAVDDIVSMISEQL